MFNDEKVGQSSNNSRERKTKSNKWKYPKTPINKIYDKKIFEPFPKYTIKEWEETYTSTQNDKDIHILPLDNINMTINLPNKYNFLHIGLIQVAIKPLARAGLGAPIVICVTDRRHRDFHNSLLAMVELDSSNGPFYFNCSPNLAVPFKDFQMSGLLSLKIKTNGMPLALTYRVVVKGMHDLDNTRSLLEYSPGETGYVQGSVRGSTKWDQVHVPESLTKHMTEHEERIADLAASFHSVFNRSS